MNKFLIVFVAILGCSYGYIAKGYFENLARSWMSIPRGGSTTTVAPVLADNLIITGVLDGPLPGGLPKTVELYVGNDIPDLSIYGVGSAQNGGGTDGQEFTFPVGSSATKGQYIYLATEEANFNAYFGFNPHYTTSAVNVNGDDAIELFENNVAIDVYGDIATDGTGTAWDYKDGWAYRMSGSSITTTFATADWTISGIDVLDGSTTNAGASSPWPLGTYTP